MKTNRPNVVYILADDMGYGDVGAMNPESKIPTPHIDALARGGMRFTDAHASSAVCTPSRYSILTGRYNWRSSLKQKVLFGNDGPLIEPNRPTVANILQQQGYHTACIGKWHLGWNWARDAEGEIDFSAPISDGPCQKGFDEFYGMIASLDIPPYVYVEGNQPTSVPTRTIEEEPGKRYWREGPISDDFDHQECLPNLTQRARRVISERAGEDDPFFLYFPLPAPHTPILPSAEFLGKSGTNEYGDFCMMVDDVVGQLVTELRTHDLLDNTIVVFTTDNGCSPSADFEELAAVGHQPSYHFRGHKADIYEGGHRVPLIIQWPDGIAPDTQSDETVCLVDLLATMADVLDVDLPDTMAEDSVSNLPLWKGDSLDAPLREATVHHSLFGSFSIRQGRWKLEFCPGSGGWSFPAPWSEEAASLPPMQLYDLTADVGERTNVQAEYPEVVASLTALMTQYVRDGRSTPGQPQANTGPAHWPQLNWMLDPSQPT